MKKIFKNIIMIILTVLLVNLFGTYKVQSADINVDAKYAIALDSKTKIPLYEKNSNILVPMASTTKIMTSLVAIKYGDLNKKIEISPKAAAIRGSTVGYKKGEKITLRELLCGLMLRSGNDAAIAIAEGISGSVEQFSDLMNEYALEIGIYNSHFESPHGLDSDKHYTTAYDLAVLTSKAKENKIFNDIVSAKDIDTNRYNFTRSYHNINKILWQIPKANGVKTGYTGKAGKCLVSSVNINGNDVIIVLLNSTPRWKETKKIYDYIIKNYEYRKWFSKNKVFNQVEDEGVLRFKLKKDIVIPVKNNCEYEVKIGNPKNYYNIKKGSDFGVIRIYQDKKLIYSEPLQLDNSIKKPKFYEKFFNNK